MPSSEHEHDSGEGHEQRVLERRVRSRPENTCENSVSVGWKTIVGGSVYALPSRLKAVSTIQSTGKNRTNATIQVTVGPEMPQGPLARAALVPVGACRSPCCHLSPSPPTP